MAIATIVALGVYFMDQANEVYWVSHKNKPEGYKAPEYQQIWMTGVGWVTWFIMKEMVDQVGAPIVRSLIPNHSEYVNNADWKRKVAKGTNHFWCMTYYIMSAYWGWCMLKESKWMPWFIGGVNPEASVEAVLVPLFIETPPGIHCYILFNFGYYLQDLTNLLIKEEKDEDFVMKTLYIVTLLCFYPGFIFGNMMGIGVMLMWLTDVSSIFVHMSLLWVDTEKTVPILATYLLMLAVFVYTRLGVLPYYMYRIATEMRFPEKISQFDNLIYMNLVFIGILLCFHIYTFFTYLMLGMGLLTGKAAPAKVEAKKVEKAKE